MTTTKKTVYSGTLTDSSATLYSVPSATGSGFELESIVLTNKTDITGSDSTVTILVNDLELISAHLITARDTLKFDNIGIVLPGGSTIKGNAGAVATVNCFITGQVTK